MADYQIKPETKRSQELMATLCEKKVQREKMVGDINHLKTEFENNLRRMEKELSKHDESIIQVRLNLKAEMSKLDPDLFGMTG